MVLENFRRLRFIVLRNVCEQLNGYFVYDPQATQSFLENTRTLRHRWTSSLHPLLVFHFPTYQSVTQQNSFEKASSAISSVY